MLGRFATQIVAGILANLIYNHAMEDGISNSRELDPQLAYEIIRRNEELEREARKVEELGKLVV